MSAPKRMTEDAIERQGRLAELGDKDALQVLETELARARASEDAKDKEIERLTATCSNLTSVAASQRGMIETRDTEIERLKADNAALDRAATTAAAELRHTYGHVDLGQSINPDLVARAIRILEGATAQPNSGDP